ncbi:MAG TPA: C45 family peptidase [Candidatus Polarisedimenticolia bacterium]|nr:C45 family peptidase [Candidatus Polarisedimenticolia bacterium]
MRHGRRWVVVANWMAVVAVVCVGLMIASSSAAQAQESSSASSDARLQKAYRFQQGGWTYVHLEGSSSEIGYQHGFLLAPEIADALDAIKLFDTHQTQRDWEFFRKTAREMLWPHIDLEYQQELQGIADGVKAHGVDLDVYDIVALNAFEEVPDYYVPWLNQREKQARAPKLKAPGNCSAFIATGAYTKDHQIVIAHNNWTSYLAGERWVVIFDILPQHGQRILMDGFPGVITSDDDFGVNAAGIMITETTMAQFEGWDPKGKPEFMRSRKALQYAQSIDDYVRIIKEGNNGGYANDWLIGDRKTGEIAYLELGLKNTPLWRTKDGYFVSSNFARDPKLIREETSGFDPQDMSSSMNARHARADELVQHAKGTIDVEMAEGFLADHFDSFEKTSSHVEKVQPNERSLCGHVDASPRGVKQWGWDAYNPGGAVQGKATDSKMAANMSFVARAGHPYGADFVAADFLEQHPEYSWQKPLLRDMKAGPWTKFQSGQKGQ